MEQASVQNDANAGPSNSTEPGENRWLCTLLLNQGQRIEYCAASSSKTNAPGDFATFFNQRRRRWSLSTVAVLLFASTIAPATVILVVQSAFQYVFGISAVGAFMLSLIPIVIYVVICYITAPSFQITVAQILTLAYGLVMMAVLVVVVVYIHMKYS